MVQGGEVDWLAEGPGEAAGPAVSPQREAAAVRSRRGRGQARAPVFGRAGGILSALRSPSEPPGDPVASGTSCLRHLPGALL